MRKQVIATSSRLLRRVSLRYRRSCINTIKHDFPNALPDLERVNFDATFMVDIVSYGIPDLVYSSEELDGSDDEDFGPKMNLADDVK